MFLLRCWRSHRRPLRLRHRRAGGHHPRLLPGADPEEQPGQRVWAAHCAVRHRRHGLTGEDRFPPRSLQ